MLHVDQLVRDRYRIEALLGQGGMGAVYRATDEAFAAHVALKENQVVTPESQRQFQREASLLYRMRHPNLPRVIDYFAIPDHGQYLVMDYVEGEDLKQVLARRGPVPEAVALSWIGQVLDALAHLHSKQIIHRDVKPANVKITPEGQVFLVDFGLAKVYNPAEETTVGARGVTPGYAPPEQYGAGRTDERTDVYSAAATLYALLSGAPPPDALDLVVGRATLEPLRRLRPDVSSHVEQAVQRAMATRPDDRFPSISAFRHALAAEPAPVPVAPASPQPIAHHVPETRLRGGASPGVRAEEARAQAPGAPPASTPSPTPVVVPSAGPAVPRRAAAAVREQARRVQRRLAARPERWLLGAIGAVVACLVLTLLALAVQRSANDILFTRLVDGRPQVYRLRGTQEERVAGIPVDAASEDAAWSPQGILFTSNIDGQREVYRVSREEVERVTYTRDGAGSWGAVWTLQGVLFTSDRDGRREVYRVAGSKGVQRVTTTPGDAESWGAVWSPQGILFTSDRDGHREVYRLAGSEGVERVTHTPDGAESWGAVWTPQGTLFTSNRDGHPELYRLGGGEKPERVTYAHDGTGSWDAAWSLRGIVFTSDREGEPQVYRLQRDGAERLTAGSGASWLRRRE